MNLKTLNFNTVVIGCGVAGMTACIYLKRAGLDICVIERTAPGGQLNMINEINNYPGYKSIDGPTLAFNIFDQIRELEIPYEYGIVKEIINEDGYKIVKTDKKEITCKNVIIATGRRPRELGISNEKKLLGHGVSYCAICDGTLYKNKEVCVVGGGNSAFEAALYLSDICKKVTLVHRTNEFRAEKMNRDKVFNKENIEVITNSKIKEIKERNDVLEGIVLDNGNTIEVSALFVYVGNVPGSIKCENLSTEENYIIVDNNMKTNVDGIYACGDAIKKSVYQISTATAEGTIAAMSIINSK